MIKILEPQYGDRFVGRGDKIRELKDKIGNNGIVVVTGERGIGKTNLMKVVKNDFENQRECHYVEHGKLFSEEVNRIFLPERKFTGVSGGFFGISGGVSWESRGHSILEYMEKSKDRIIFVENAQELNETETETIYVASRRNDRLRFVLEIATPHMPEVNLNPGSYGVVELHELSDESIEKIVKSECPQFSDAIVERIISLSSGYPYVARSLAYICANKNTEAGMVRFLSTLRDKDMKYNLDGIHNEVLNTLSKDSQDVIKRLAIATPILTLKLIKAFCKVIPVELDNALSDLFHRGILVKEEADGEGLYRIYHPLFREFLRSDRIQPVASTDWKDYYRNAMDDVKAEYDSIFILLEVLNEPDFFVELSNIADNFVVINSVARLAYIRGKLEEAISALKVLFDKAEKRNDKEWEAIATGNIGIVYQTRGELDTALEYFEKALKLYEELDNKAGISADYGNIGNVYLTRGELDTALQYFEKALKLNKKIGRKEGVAIQYGNIGNVYRTRNELDTALEYYENALKIFRELGSRIETARTLMNIGSVFAQKGDKERALSYYREAKELAKGGYVIEAVINRLKRMEV